jgi:hypothetical protein
VIDTLYVYTNAKRSRLAKLAFSRDGRSLVATSYATALAWVIDATDYRAQTVIPLAKGPMGIAFPADGHTASCPATIAGCSRGSISRESACLARTTAARASR